MASSKMEKGHRLETFPQCLDCLYGLTDAAAGFAAGNDESLLQEARAAGRRVLAQTREAGLTSPEVANLVIREIKRITGVVDPYREFKDQERVTAARASARARQLLADDLRDRVALAALGNSLDFFMSPEQSLAQVEQKAREGLSFQRDDRQRLRLALETGPGLVLYLTDNTGEIHFDLPLYEYISARARRAVLVVKGGPALNDLTRDELGRSGLASHFSEVADTGSDGVGIEWELASAEFHDLVRSADLIISKGMANLETISPHPLPCPVFFIFQVKCGPIRDFLDAEPNSYWAMWREGNRA